MVPEGGVGQNVEIENVNTRVSFENLQKQRNFDVRIHEGTCENLGEKIHSVRCSNCLNSLAVKIMGSQKKLHIKGDGSEGDLVALWPLGRRAKKSSPTLLWRHCLPVKALAL